MFDLEVIDLNYDNSIRKLNFNTKDWACFTSVKLKGEFTLKV